mgnify:CR=1 FL=1
MKILKRLLYVIMILFVLLCMLVLLCALVPGMTEKIAGFLYRDGNRPATVETSDSPPPEERVEVPESSIREDNSDAQEKLADAGLAGIAEEITSSYIPPNQAAIVIPAEVSGRNGYQQIQGENEQIDEETAGRLESQLDTGYTGDGLAFDGLYYPYYAMLDETGKHLYRQIYANANELYAVFAPVEEVTAGQLKNIFSAVYNDHPELFWMETAYACKYKKGGPCVEITLKFNRTAQDLAGAKAVFHENANPIIAGAQQLSSNYEKEKFVHNALIDRIDYNLRAEMNQSAYSALVNGQTVCAGYARAFQYLLQQLGIPCYYCTGYAGESHAWNIVALEDGYYNVDTTWDDTGGGNYDYFNKTDSDYGSSHIRQELSVYLPPCNGQAYRDLEPEEESSLRSLADVGISEDQVITDMAGYYEDCYSQLVQNGRGNYTFYNVIEGEQLLEEWYQEHQLENYWEAYMNNAIEAVGASYCEIGLEVEALQGERYLFGHKTSIW